MHHSPHMCSTIETQVSLGCRGSALQEWLLDRCECGRCMLVFDEDVMSKVVQWVLPPILQGYGVDHHSKLSCHKKKEQLAKDAS